MIELDIVSHDMFDLPPLSEYELYVKKFGADDTRQVSGCVKWGIPLNRNLAVEPQITIQNLAVFVIETATTCLLQCTVPIIQNAGCCEWPLYYYAMPHGQPVSYTPWFGVHLLHV